MPKSEFSDGLEEWRKLTVDLLKKVDRIKEAMGVIAQESKAPLSSKIRTREAKIIRKEIFETIITLEYVGYSWRLINVIFNKCENERNGIEITTKTKISDHRVSVNRAFEKKEINGSPNIIIIKKKNNSIKKQWVNRSEISKFSFVSF